VRVRNDDQFHAPELADLHVIELNNPCGMYYF
jgi:hypothetical protein